MENIGLSRWYGNYIPLCIPSLKLAFLHLKIGREPKGKDRLSTTSFQGSVGFQQKTSHLAIPFVFWTPINVVSNKLVLSITHAYPAFFLNIYRVNVGKYTIQHIHSIGVMESNFHIFMGKRWSWQPPQRWRSLEDDGGPTFVTGLTPRPWDFWL